MTEEELKEIEKRWAEIQSERAKLRVQALEKIERNDWTGLREICDKQIAFIEELKAMIGPISP